MKVTNKLFSISLILIITIFFASCNSTETKKSTTTNMGIVVGNINKSNIDEASVVISLDSASRLMDRYNRLTLSNFEYNYTNAWIEIVAMEDGSYSYFLGLKASLSAKDEGDTYSCYSIFTKLVNYDQKLYFKATAEQQSCTGKCCEGCRLTVTEDTWECECDTPSTKNNCKNNRCKHEISNELSEDQIKSAII